VAAACDAAFTLQRSPTKVKPARVTKLNQHLLTQNAAKNESQPLVQHRASAGQGQNIPNSKNKKVQP
jgi:hypothetical protein